VVVRLSAVGTSMSSVSTCRDGLTQLTDVRTARKILAWSELAPVPPARALAAAIICMMPPSAIIPTNPNRLRNAKQTKGSATISDKSTLMADVLASAAAPATAFYGRAASPTTLSKKFSVGPKPYCGPSRRMFVLTDRLPGPSLSAPAARDLSPEGDFLFEGLSSLASRPPDIRPAHAAGFSFKSLDPYPDVENSTPRLNADRLLPS
jgi:hypothetical protein